VLIEIVISLIASVIVLQIMVFSTTIYLHRYATHRAMQMHPAAAWVFRFALWITTGIVPREWVAVHRKHHAHTDEHGDPHSPVLEGFWAHPVGNVFYYIRRRATRRRSRPTPRTCKRDWWDRLFFDYSNFGIIVGTTILCLIFGWWGLHRGCRRVPVHLRAVVLDQRSLPPSRLQELRRTPPGTSGRSR
jgi:stearoyl-CoA desaturase (delta-9 desaturase)